MGKTKQKKKNQQQENDSYQNNIEESPTKIEKMQNQRNSPLETRDNQKFLSNMSSPDRSQKYNQESYDKYTVSLVSKVEDILLNYHRNMDQEIQQISDKYNVMINDTVQQLKDQNQVHQDFLETPKQQKYFFIEKQFKINESLLSKLLKISDYRTLYNITIASMTALALNLIFVDYFEKGQLLDVETLYWCFSGFKDIILPWFELTALSFCIIPFTKWIIEYKISKYIWIPIYILIITLCTFIGCNTCVKYNLGMASALTIQIEMVRIGLKMHSYIRNKLLYCITDNQYRDFIPEEFQKRGMTLKDLYQPKYNMLDLFGEVKRFAYFFAAPTLIYRDQYIYSPKRCLRNAFFHFLNFFLCIYFGFILFKTFCKDQIIQMTTNFSYSSFIICQFKLIMPSTFSIFLLFFGLLHSWFNAWAELLRFPDRTFYMDWWNSEEFGTYYRKWNIVVHEFLFYYAYGDTVRFSKGKYGRGVGMFITFFTSAIIHELILSFAIGYFFPILLLVFGGPGIILIQNQKKVTSKNFNIAFWLLMYNGTSLIITLYLTEDWARRNVNDSIINQQWGIFASLIPRILYINYNNIKG